MGPWPAPRAAPAMPSLGLGAAKPCSPPQLYTIITRIFKRNGSQLKIEVNQNAKSHPPQRSHLTPVGEPRAPRKRPNLRRTKRGRRHSPKDSRLSLTPHPSTPAHHVASLSLPVRGPTVTPPLKLWLAPPANHRHLPPNASHPK